MEIVTEDPEGWAPTDLFEGFSIESSSYGKGSKAVGHAEEAKEGDDDVTGEESIQDSNFGLPSQWLKASINSGHGPGLRGSLTQVVDLLFKPIDPTDCYGPDQIRVSRLKSPVEDSFPHHEASGELGAVAPLRQDEHSLP